MDSAARRTGGLFEGLYKVIMRRNSVYVTFIIAGAFVGERLLDLWYFDLNKSFGEGFDYVPVVRSRRRSTGICIQFEP